jgi:hypothetical protein
MRSVWPIFIIDFNCRPKILKQVILERRVPQNRIAESPNDRPRLWSRSAIGRRTKLGIDRDLDADRRLNIEVTPAFAPRQGGLRNQDIVRDAGPVTTWNGHLEEAGHNVVAVFLVGGNEPVLRKEGRPISRRVWVPLGPEAEITGGAATIISVLYVGINSTLGPPGPPLLSRRWPLPCEPVPFFWS